MDKEEVLRVLGRVLVLPVIDGKYRTPVVTLHNSDTSNLYSLIERQLRSEYHLSAEKWWKIIRTDQNLDTWRPRVHGTQLKALLNCRLPEQPEEYATVEKTVNSLKFALRPDTSPDKFVSELRKFIAGVEVWWDNRNSRRPPGEAQVQGTLKRPAASMGPALGAKQQQQQQQQGGTPKKAFQGPSSGMYSQGPSMMGFRSNYSDSGLPLRDSQEDLFAGNGSGDMMGGPRPGLGGIVPPLPNPGDSCAVVQLNVGGKVFSTTVGTLLSVPNTYFWEVLGSAHDGAAPLRTNSGELFVDRNGKLFTYVLEYLRAVSNNESYFPMPEDANELVALAREADFYGLPGLLERIQGTSIMPQQSTRAVYDSIYLETGFNSIEGPSLKEMEQRKVVVMQQMNHVLAQKALDGFFVAACDCGVNHRDGPDGMQHNLFYHILLKRVSPVPPSLAQSMQVPPGPMQMTGPQMHPGMPPSGGQMPLPIPMPMPGQPGGMRMPGM